MTNFVEPLNIVIRKIPNAMKRLLIILTLIPLFAAAQHDYAKMHISHSELTPGIHRLFVGDVVTVVAYTGDEGLMVIDAAYEQTVTQLIDTLKRISDQPVKYLINTHIHADHTGGNIELGKNATIIAHHSVKKWLASDRKQGDKIPGPLPQHAIPNFTFEGSLNMDFNGQTLNIYHLPGGHTAGDIIIYFSKSNVLVLGDLLFADNFPFVDTSQGGNPLIYLQNIKWILENFPTDAIVVGGHGPVYSMEQLREWLTNLELSVEVMTEAKNNGLTAQQMKERRILSKWDSYGNFFITGDRWIDTWYPFIEQ